MIITASPVRLNQTPHHNGRLPMTADQILDALADGVMVRKAGGFTWLPHRRCTDCGEELAYQQMSGRAATFPRCSRHAF